VTVQFPAYFAYPLKGPDYPQPNSPDMPRPLTKDTRQLPRAVRSLSLSEVSERASEARIAWDWMGGRACD
jgi:hypothetical protein